MQLKLYINNHFNSHKLSWKKIPPNRIDGKNFQIFKTNKFMFRLAE